MPPKKAEPKKEQAEPELVRWRSRCFCKTHCFQPPVNVAVTLTDLKTCTLLLKSESSAVASTIIDFLALYTVTGGFLSRAESVC